MSFPSRPTVRMSGLAKRLTQGADPAVGHEVSKLDSVWRKRNGHVHSMRWFGGSPAQRVEPHKPHDPRQLSGVSNPASEA